MDGVSFNCKETPITFPSGFDMTTLVEDTTAKLRLISLSPGPGTVTALSNGEGLTIEENVTTEIHINSPENSSNSRFRYTQYDTRFYVPPAHNLPSETDIVAEYCIYFRNMANPSKVVCLVLLCKKGISTDSTASYFETLSVSSNPNRPVLSTLFAPNDSFVEYVGADLRGRTSTSPLPRNLCDPVKQYVTYYLCTTPISLGVAFSALNNILSPTTTAAGPPRWTTPTNDLMKLVSLVKGIRLGDPTSKPKSNSTSALKCYRIDPATDISGGKIVIKSSSTTTLDQEIAAVSEGNSPTVKSIQPGDVEEYVAIAAGIVGVILLGVVGYFLYRSRQDDVRAEAALLKAAKEYEAERAEANADANANANANANVVAAPKGFAALGGIPALLGVVVGFVLALLLWLFFYSGNNSNAQLTAVTVCMALAMLGGGLYAAYNYFIADP
jgi:hypothetical protein